MGSVRVIAHVATLWGILRRWSLSGLLVKTITGLLVALRCLILLLVVLWRLILLLVELLWCLVRLLVILWRRSLW